MSTSTAFPALDTDPHFTRVVRYFRGSDYASWAAVIAAFPSALFALEYVNPTSALSPHKMRTAYRMGAVFGAFGGFLLAYQRSSLRLWGWTENERERKLYMTDIAKAVKEGRDVHGVESGRLTPYMQRIAAGNSRYAATKFDVIPWFNLVAHPFHGEFNREMVRTAEEALKA